MKTLKRKLIEYRNELANKRSKEHQELIGKINNLIKSVDNQKVELDLPKEVELKYSHKEPRKVEVENFPEPQEIPDKVKAEITNFPKQQDKVSIKGHISVKKPIWYKAFKFSYDTINKGLSSLGAMVITGMEEVLAKHQSAKNPFAVRLVDRYGRFYDAITSAGGGGCCPTASSLSIGTATVAAAGVRVQVSAASVPAKSVSIQADTANAGDIYVGDNTVAAANGYILHQGQSIEMDIDDLNLVYIDAANNGDSVRWLIIN